MANLNKHLEKRIAALEQAAHSAHTIDAEALDKIADIVLAKLIARIDGIAQAQEAQDEAKEQIE